MEYEVKIGEQCWTVRFEEREGQLFVTHEGGTFPVRFESPLRSRAQRVQMNGEPLHFGHHRDKDGVVIVLDGALYEAEVRELAHVRFTRLAKRPTGLTKMEVRAPMPGMVATVRAKPGDVVKKGQSLLSLHAMKLENDIRSPGAGVVREVRVSEGDVVEKGALMVLLGPEPAPEPKGEAQA